jgi:hypothetical protein
MVAAVVAAGRWQRGNGSAAAAAWQFVACCKSKKDTTKARRYLKKILPVTMN